jgi:hypothetical protein
MSDFYYPRYPDELYHHGVLGMKWGVRRYQNPDGSLTAAGRKRQAKKETREAKKKAKAEEEKRRHRSVKDMSDDELRTKINRLQMEKQYLDLNKQVSALEPRHVSAGEKFVKGVGETVIPAVKNAGKNLAQQYLEKKGKEMLGLNSTDSVESLRKEAQSLNYKKQINEAKKYFENEKKQNSQSSTSTTKKATSGGSDTNFRSSYAKGTVEGEGTSKGSQSRRDRDRGPIYDAEYTEVNTKSPSVQPTIRLGQTYVSGYLEDKRKKR